MIYGYNEGDMQATRELTNQVIFFKQDQYTIGHKDTFVSDGNTAHIIIFDDLMLKVRQAQWSTKPVRGKEQRCLIPCAGFYADVLGRMAYIYNPDFLYFYIGGVCDYLDDDPGSFRFSIETYTNSEFPVIARSDRLIEYLGIEEQAKLMQDGNPPNMIVKFTFD